MNQFANAAKYAANAANAGSNPMGQVAATNPLGSLMSIAKVSSSASPVGVGVAAFKASGKYLMEVLKKMFRLDTFKLIVMLLQFMAYVVFILATLLFVNACILFHKTQTDTVQTPNNKKLKDLPIFDALKTNNFMLLDTFIMNKDSKLFIAITSIIGGAIGLLILHAIVLSYAEEKEKASFVKYYTTELSNHPITYIIVAIIYFVFYVVFISAYYTQIANNSCVPDANFNTYRKDNKNIIQYKKEALLAIKKTIQQKLYSGSGGFNATDYDTHKYSDAKGKVAVDIDIASIFLIYENNRKNKIKKAENDLVDAEQVKREVQQYTREYINYIDEYFELLGRNADNYQKFYLVGLIEHDDANETNDANIYILYRGFKNNLKTMTSKIATYFILIITFYTLMCMAIFALLFVSNTSIQKAVIETIYRIARTLRIV
jgi:hypothetical protein